MPHYEVSQRAGCLKSAMVGTAVLVYLKYINLFKLIQILATKDWELSSSRTRMYRKQQLHMPADDCIDQSRMTNATAPSS